MSLLSHVMLAGIIAAKVEELRSASDSHDIAFLSGEIGGLVRAANLFGMPKEQANQILESTKALAKQRLRS